MNIFIILNNFKIINLLTILIKTITKLLQIWQKKNINDKDSFSNHQDIITKILLLYLALSPLRTEQMLNTVSKTCLLVDLNTTLGKEEFLLKIPMMMRMMMDSSVLQVMRIMKNKGSIRDISFKILAVRWLKLKTRTQLLEMATTILQNSQVN